MASSAEQVIARFRSEFYPDCPSARASTLWQEAWQRGTVLFRLRETTLHINLVAGVATYPLTGEVAAIREVRYELSSDPSGWRKLAGCSLDSFAASGAIGEPTRYALQNLASDSGAGRVLRLDPIPGVSTSGGYPRLGLEVVGRSQLSGDDVLPAFLLTDEWFLYEMAFRYAVRQDRESAEFWRALREDEQAQWSRFLKSADDEVPPLQFLSPFAERLSRPT